MNVELNENTPRDISFSFKNGRYVIIPPKNSTMEDIISALRECADFLEAPSTLVEGDL